MYTSLMKRYAALLGWLCAATAGAQSLRLDPPEISLSGPGRDYDEEVEFLGTPLRVVRVGTEGSIDRAIEALAPRG